MTATEFASLLQQRLYPVALEAVRAILAAPNGADLCEKIAFVLQDHAQVNDDGTDAVFEAIYRAAIDLQSKAHGDNSEQTWVAWWWLAAFYEHRRRIEEAGQAYKAMVGIAENLADSQPELLERSLSRLADLLVQSGDMKGSEQLLRRAIDSRERGGAERQQREGLAGKKGPDLSELLGDLHQVLLRQGRLDEATQVFARRVEEGCHNRSLLGSDEIADWIYLADLYRRQNRYLEAEQLLLRSLQSRERKYGAEHVYVGFTARDLGLLYAEMGKPADAIPLLRHALAILAREHGTSDDQVRQVEGALAKLAP